jgi:hypothetical protein
MAMATHAGMTTEEFEQIVREWITTAKHPSTGRLYTKMVYQPMLELLAYLRANGFKTFIVSGGGIEFVRPCSAERVYGVPPEQVVGSSIKTKYEVRDGKPVIVRLPEINFIDDKAANRSAFSSTSAVVRSSPSAIPTATSRCWSGPRPATGCVSACSFTTPTPTANGPTTASRTSVASRAASTKVLTAAGRSSA